MRRIVVLAAVVPLAAACGGHRGVNVKHVLAAHVQRCAAGARLPLGSAKLAYAAVVPRHTVAYREPGRRAIARFGPKNVNDYPTVFGVLGAVGISAFSPVLTGWPQGGPIAIHGTNEPWSIGRAVSNGCIRMPNPVLRKLFAQTPSGTPVLIRR